MNENSFFSIDKLVEFGMGMAISQQMISTMNQAMNQMHIAGSMNQFQSNEQSEFVYFVIDNISTGPFSIREMLTLIKDKNISNKTLVWKPGMKNWECLENVPSLLKYIAIQPPKLP
jgi:hypothetical protein